MNKVNFYGKDYHVGERKLDTLEEARVTGKNMLDEPDKIENVLAIGIFKNGNNYLVKYIYR